MLLAANASPILLSIVVPYLVGAIICPVGICLENIWEQLQESRDHLPPIQCPAQESHGNASNTGFEELPVELASHHRHPGHGFVGEGTTSTSLRLKE